MRKYFPLSQSVQCLVLVSAVEVVFLVITRGLRAPHHHPLTGVVHMTMTAIKVKDETGRSYHLKVKNDAGSVPCFPLGA